MQHLLFDYSDRTFEGLAGEHLTSKPDPLPVSPWVAMSALQKAIRRGEVVLATRAAATLLDQDPTRLWRRLAGIVFEDVGLGSVDTIRLVIAAAAGKTFRQQFGGEWAVASLLIERMCSASKCRATDDLFLAISFHHELEELRATLEGVGMSEHLSRIRERGALLAASLAALRASGVRWTGQVTERPAGAAVTFAAMSDAGADYKIVELAEQGFRRTREALPVLLPMLTHTLPTGRLEIQDDELPTVVIGRSGIPTYCYDGFSWEGKAALARFLMSDRPTSLWLRKHVPAKRRLAVLAGGLFRVDGGLVRQRLMWPCATLFRSHVS